MFSEGMGRITYLLLLKILLLAGEEIFFIQNGFEFKRKNEFQKALESYDKALELVPNDIVVLLEKAKLLIDLDRPEESVAICDKILEIDPFVYPEYDKRCTEIESQIPGWSEDHMCLENPRDREFVLNCKLQALWNLKSWNLMKKVKRQIFDWENSPDRVNPLELLLNIRKEKGSTVEEEEIFSELNNQINQILNNPERLTRKEELRKQNKIQTTL